MSGSRKRQKKLRLRLLVSLILLCTAAPAAVYGIGRLHLGKYNEWQLVIDLQGSEEMILECGETYEEPGASATLYGSRILRKGKPVEVKHSGKTDPARPGSYVILYRAETQTAEPVVYRGLRKSIITEQKRTVIYRDTAAPIITLEGDSESVVPYGAHYPEAGYHAYDAVDGDLTDEVQREERVDEVRYTVKDRSGNEASASRKLRRIDITPPRLKLKGDARPRCRWNEQYKEQGYIAVDEVDGNLTGKVVREIREDCILYRVSDSAGNESTVIRYIEYYDDIAPVLVLKGDKKVSLAYGQAWTDPGCTAEDDKDGDLTDKIRAEGSVDPNAAGEYKIEYSVKDQAGNEARAARLVTVRSRAVDVQTDVPGADKTIYLTYDDGPCENTERLLDILDKYQVKATFFVVGKQPEYLPLLKRMAESGHSIGIHSLTHDYKVIYSGENGFFADIEAMADLIEQYGGVRTRLLRFPGGSSNTVSRNYSRGIMSRLTKEAEARGYRYFDWNVSSGDADTNTYQTRSSVYNFVTEGCKRKNVSVVLNHDTKSFSVDAMEDIIRWGLANGYSFKALTEESPGMHQNVIN